MGFVDSIVTGPVWRNVCKKPFFRMDWKWKIRFISAPELFECSVFEATLNPFGHNSTVIVTEGLRIFSPHLHGRMILPAIVRIKNRLENLQVLDTLLAEALVVEDRRRFGVVGKRQECLHGIRI